MLNVGYNCEHAQKYNMGFDHIDGHKLNQICVKVPPNPAASCAN